MAQLIDFAQWIVDTLELSYELTPREQVILTYAKQILDQYGTEI